MTKTNHKQDIPNNDSEQNTKQQQPDMAERQSLQVREHTI